MTQQVQASITCVPGTTAEGSTIGCTLTVTNIGGNSVNNVVVTDQASGGTFLTSSSSKCTVSGSTLTCNIGKLSGGGAFSETHELQVPSSGASVVQTISGRYSQNPNNRGSDDILAPPPLTTTLDSSGNFDARFANANGESVQTDGIASGNPSSSEAVLLVGTTGFTVGLSVREQSAGTANPNCPAAGCFNGEVVQFDITTLPGGAGLPASYVLTLKLTVPNGTQESELDLRHDGNLVPLCPATDPVGACIDDRDISGGSTKIATIIVEGPGTGNGGWGVG